ncbi:hypothetical protein N7462_004432 [Penicillium macrosclerotiorum]|uniref:uncharacterized protein n=1 Tax=Penicillium macrosclerotiorum TaxID=303699 RepID=UPI0025487B3F|nr:uncharacterized protein N7462_004432 [Penicillium macrosclerotiorum]KAJ5690040.1 hypothetical protein N7462_004432 [Penicillium macrosclerotiorum]
MIGEMLCNVDNGKDKPVHDERAVEIDPAAEKRLVRKIDLYLMPSVFVLYLFSYVDRSNIGLAKIAGMEQDLNLTSAQYYTAVIVWVIGYTIAAVPSNMILARTRPSVFIPLITFGWGSVAALLGAIKSPSHLIALRLLLGVFEAGFSVSHPVHVMKGTEIELVRSTTQQPAVIFLISTWYKKNEQSKRFIIFLTAGILSGAFGSVVSGAITSTLDGAHGVRGWRWLFIAEGVTTAGISLIAHWTLLDYPHKSRGLRPDEQKLSQERLIQDGMAGPIGNPQAGHTSIFVSFLKAICDWRAWFLVPAYMSILGALSLSYFYPTLLNGMGYSSTAAQYMTAPLYLVSLVIALPVCYLADRRPHSRGLFLVINMVVGLVFFALTAGIKNYTARYIFLCFINMTIWTGNALGLSFATTALGSVNQDVRAIMLALMNGLAALAQLYGSALFPDKDGPEYLTAFSVFAATFAVGAVLYGVADVLFKKYPYQA